MTPTAKSIPFLCGFLAFVMNSPLVAQTPLIISGVEDALESQIVAQLTKLQQPCSASQARVRAVESRNAEELRDIVRALGFYRANQKIASEQVEGCWQIQVELDLGEKMRYQNVEINLQGEGSSDAELRSLVNTSPLQSGRSLDHGQYEDFKAELSRVALRRGYFDARFEVAELRVDVENNQAEAVLVYDTGVRYRFGELRSDQTTISDELLYRFLPYAKGEYYEAEKIQVFQTSLLDSQYFSSVVARPLVDQRAVGLVPVQLETSPMNRWRYEAGIGVATDTGPIFSLGVDNRRVTEGGQRASMDISWSELLKTGQIGYSIPLTKAATDVLQWQLGARDEITDSAKAEQISAGVSRLSVAESGWAQTISLTYSIEESTIAGQIFNSQLLIPGASWSRSKKVGNRRIERGWRLALDIQGAAETLASDFNFFQIRSSAKDIIGFGSGRIITRAEAGATYVENFDDVPVSIRFFAGGDNSIRGYDLNSIGPTDDAGDVVGGRYLLVGSVEYAYPVKTNWDIAAFVDAGNAFDNKTQTMKLSRGIGLRWHSIIGTLRFDLAAPVDNSGPKLHIFIGPEI